MTIEADSLARIRVKAEHRDSGEPFGITTHPDPEGPFCNYEQAEIRISAVVALANSKVRKATEDAKSEIEALKAKIDAYQTLIDDAALLESAHRQAKAAGLKDGNIRKHHRLALNVLGVQITADNTEDAAP